MADDLAEVAARFGAALRLAGLPVGPGRCERFAAAVTLARPQTPRALYLCAAATLVSSKAHAATLESVFSAVFGGAADPAGPRGDAGAQVLAFRPARTPEDMLASAARAAREHAGSLPPEAGGREARPDRQPDRRPGGPERIIEDRFLGSAAERLAAKDFAELSPDELTAVADLMRRITLSVPLRRSRRQRRRRRGPHPDMRATLRRARRTGGDPVHLIGRAPVRRQRRLVVLCDISGSMEPYARAMIQLLYCAAGGARAELFSFATRLTRLTPALAASSPDTMLAKAGEAAPDWSGGTRIGAAIKEFNDHYGARGLARGAVVLIISDGWETGEPALLGAQMARLSRIAHRIVWANPRTQSPRYRPEVGGMAAAWPYCDAVVSAHSLDALADLLSALRAR
jgi:hypothetical protein